MTKPTTHQRDLVKLPRALAALIERPQWCVWRWTQQLDGKWQKPPYQARDPRRHASSTDPSTWSDYSTALAAVQAGHADGITYVLTTDDPFAAIDLDHCRDADTHSIEIWAQLFLERGRDTYAEVTPSGDGVRIWGLANGAALNRKFTLEIDAKKVAAELFRRTNKALTITGYTLDPAIHELTNIDRTLDWAVIWGERRKAAAAPLPCSGNGFTSNGNGCGYSIDQIEQIVCAGAPAGDNRSDVFHTLVGHYAGCSWPIERIYQHLRQFPNGIGEKYISEGRLALEVSRSFRKWAQLPLLAGNELAQWTSEWMTKAPQPETVEEDDPELRNDQDDLEPEPAGVDDPELHEPQKPHVEEPEKDIDLDDNDLGDDVLDGEPKEVGTAADVLCATVFELPNYAVPGYIVEGLTLLAGKPKIGKSWLMLQSASPWRVAASPSRIFTV